MQLTRSQKIAAEKMIIVTYVTSVDTSNGQPTYYYIAVKGDRMLEFKEALSKGFFNPLDYGAVLEWGYGLPSETVKHRMLEEYGCKTE